MGSGASESSYGWRDAIRGYLVQYLGEGLAKRLMGSKSPTILLPQIPPVNTDPSNSTTTCSDLDNKRVSKESDYLYIKEIYQATRNASPNENEIVKWMGVLRQGGSREGLYNATVLDTHYASLERINKRSSGKVVDFVVNYMSTYLDHRAERKLIAGVNIYSLKRAVTSRTIDVLDGLCSVNKNSLYSWYAVLSADLANNYSTLWKSRLRGNSNRVVHLRWAEAVSLEELKSEVIIKLQRVLNHLGGLSL